MIVEVRIWGLKWVPNILCYGNFSLTDPPRAFRSFVVCNVLFSENSSFDSFGERLVEW